MIKHTHHYHYIINISNDALFELISNDISKVDLNHSWIAMFGTSILSYRIIGVDHIYRFNLIKNKLVDIQDKLRATNHSIFVTFRKSVDCCYVVIGRYKEFPAWQ